MQDVGLEDAQIEIRFQPCGTYVSTTRNEACAETEEVRAFMSGARFNLKTTEKYIDLHSYTDMVRARMMPLLSFTGDEFLSKRIQNTLTLSQTSGAFRDDLLGAVGVELRFMSFHNNRSTVSDSSLEESGLSLDLTLHHTAKIYARQAFDLWLFLAYVGGLSVALSWIHGAFVWIYSPAVFQRSVIRHNFKFDSSSEPQKGKKRSRASSSETVVQPEQNQLKAKLDALTDRLRVKENFLLQPAALACILEKLGAISPIRISICHALVERNCTFCARSCARGRGLKYQMAYKKANKELSRHLDIRNLVKLSLDVKAFKDTLLRPQQRMLFAKQARRVVALDAESSSVCSVSSGDEEYSDRVYFERR